MNEVEMCPLCEEELEEGEETFFSWTLDMMVCYSCRYDGDNA